MLSSALFVFYRILSSGSSFKKVKIEAKSRIHKYIGALMVKGIVFLINLALGFFVAHTQRVH